MTVADSKTYKGHEIEIKYDENPESPRNWDNVCVFHIAHRRYAFGDKNYNDSESIHAAEAEAKRNGDLVLPLYMFDHSGITISLTPFSCPWDSGQVGFVQVPRKSFVEEFGKKNFTPKLKKKAREWAESETKTLDSYIRGDVYGYVIDEDGDSCWGYYSEEDAMEEAKSIVDWIVKEAKKKHCEQLKTWIKNKVPLSIRTTMEEALEV
jgi:hypothetical protein